MKIFLKIVGVILIISIVLVGGMVFYITRGLESGSKLEISKIDVSSLNDGAYIGQHDAGRFSNEVRVLIKDHKIVQIDIIDELRFEKTEVTNEIISKVLEDQNTNIDVVSGATVSSKAYLKSIENALKK